MFLVSQSLFAQNDKMDIILKHFATPARSFTTGSIPSSDLELIVQAGIRSPSARNSQAWHFTVVRDHNLSKQIIPDIQEGNVVIVISAQGDGKTNIAQILDAALAVESFYLAAQALGYGARIYTGPIENLNSKYKTDFDVPSDYNAAAIVRIGKVQTSVDTVTAASSRKKAEDIVTYK